jgi:hypothetical protein
MATAQDLAKFRKMLLTVHDRLAPMLEAGKTTDEAIKARPTSELDATWGKGFFSGGMFTRVVYEGLKAHRAETVKGS